jgi:hypothetical protein
MSYSWSSVSGARILETEGSRAVFGAEDAVTVFGTGVLGASRVRMTRAVENMLASQSESNRAPKAHSSRAGFLRGGLCRGTPSD